ncbi:hypothetical protein [Rhodococcus opacus]|uniref:hypothetical protein n=1 Tax=Rhodococcus opacus TaxID=37919 RepID=UPI00217CE6F1|nr:hypothetical protein [Rhodococcus opacus]
MTVTRVWEIEMAARSPISHRGELIGTTAIGRRMKILQPDGSVELVPVISGNSFRGVLRRIGEELLRDVLDYEGQLPLAVAHTLRNGGAIVKTQAEPITGRRLHQLRELIPQLSVFGGAIGAAPIDGCLRIGHVVPIVTEATPNLRRTYSGPIPSRFDIEALESYSPRRRDRRPRRHRRRHRRRDGWVGIAGDAVRHRNSRPWHAVRTVGAIGPRLRPRSCLRRRCAGRVHPHRVAGRSHRDRARPDRHHTRLRP